MAKNKKDTDIIDLILQGGVDLHLNRKIYFGNFSVSPDTDFTDVSVAVAMRAIDLMLSFSNAPITLHFSSYGGGIYEALGLVDKILESPCKFIFQGYGPIMSAATLIMAVCDERILGHNTTVMLHDGRNYSEGKFTDMDIDVQENLRVKAIMDEIYAENSFLPKQYWAKVVQRDLFLTAKEAIKLGLADSIRPYKKRGNFRKGAREANLGSPDKKELQKIMGVVNKRARLDATFNLNIEAKVDQSEEIASYDNSVSIEETILENKPETEV